MKKRLHLVLIFSWGSSLLCCRSKETEKYPKFSVDKNLPQSDTIKLLSEYPELKLSIREKSESKTRTAYIVQTSGYSDGFYHTYSFRFNNYKCKAENNVDSLYIWLNNNNGYFGNGVLVKVFNGKFLIKDIDPKTLKGETKFMTSAPIRQKLVLNKNSFQKNDSIYGFISYTAKIDSLVTKDFKGYFKTIIK